MSDRKGSISSQGSGVRTEKMDDMISEAATNMINAMTKIINNGHRRRSHQPDGDTDQDSSLSDPKREMLQRILTVALDRLSGGADSRRPSAVDSGKKEWIQCEFCTKRTRLRCEMKYVPSFFSLSLSRTRTHTHTHTHTHTQSLVKINYSLYPPIENTKSATNAPTAAPSPTVPKPSAAKPTGSATKTPNTTTSKPGAAHSRVAAPTATRRHVRAYSTAKRSTRSISESTTGVSTTRPCRQRLPATGWVLVEEDNTPISSRPSSGAGSVGMLCRCRVRGVLGLGTRGLTILIESIFGGGRGLRIGGRLGGRGVRMGFMMRVVLKRVVLRMRMMMKRRMTIVTATATGCTTMIS